MKDILIIANSGWNIFNFRSELIKKLNEKKYNIYISCPRDNYIDEVLKNHSYYYFPLVLDRKSFNIFSNFKIIFDILILYYKIKPDYVFSFTIKPNIYGNLASLFYFYKTKQINFITGLGTYYLSNKILKNLIFILYKIAFFKSYNVFFQNKIDQDIFISKKIIDKRKTRVIGGSGIDLKKFYYNHIGLKKGKEFKFICVSRLIKDKGIVEFLEVAKMIKMKYAEVKFILIGSIDTQNISLINIDYLKKFTNKYVTHYEFNHDIKKYIIESDCAVLPSYREGTSRFLLEAASLGRPIVTTDVPGCNNIVFNNFNGYLCEKSSINSLYNAVEKMIKTPLDIRIKMSKNSRLIVEKYFDIIKVNNQIINDLKL